MTGTWGPSVLTSARVFTRRPPIPPLCGGAAQALQNFQTNLGDHPHPASRPMTFGHFTSWRADDRGYYTGVESARERERERSWSHFWGKFLVRDGNTEIHLSHMIWNTIHMIQMIRTRTKVRHICGTKSWADVGIHTYICYM